MSEAEHPPMSDSHDAEVAEYHPLCATAVVGLVFGLLSVAALVDPFAWLFPVIGIVLSGMALARIAWIHPELLGRKAAVAGLALSLIFGSAGVSQWVVTRALLRRQARQFTTAWFEALAHGQPHIAHQLTEPPRQRRPLDNTLWKSYRTGPRWQEQLREYVAMPLVRTLLALGEKVQVRYCGTESLAHLQGGTVVNQLENIIEAVRTRSKVCRAAYTIMIASPGGETIQPRGGPCLNYIAVQLEPRPRLVLSLLAVYRNHDFLERAYGNYWGLCNLLRFLASEVEATPGPLTCVSSHAYVSGSKTALRALIGTLE